MGEDRFGGAGGKVKSGKRAGFRVVEVVALGRVKFSGRRGGAVPLHGGLGRTERVMQGLSGAVAESLIAAADAIVIHGHGIKIEMAEGFAEIPSGNAGHAEGGHGLDFMKA